MPLTQRPATQHRGPAQRPPSRAYCSLTCSSCGHQGADVGKCSVCTRVVCVAGSACHKQIFLDAAPHFEKPKLRQPGWDVSRARSKPCQRD